MGCLFARQGVALICVQEIVLWTLLQREDRAAIDPDALAINLQILDWIVRNVDGELIASLHPRFLAEVTSVLKFFLFFSALIHKQLCAAYWPFYEFLVRKLLSRMTRLASLYVAKPCTHLPPCLIFFFRCPQPSLSVIAIVGVSDARMLAEVELCWMHLLHQNERLCLACREILLACPAVVVLERSVFTSPQT